MQWCPVIKTECVVECAWFVQGECAMVALHQLGNDVEELVEELKISNDTLVKNGKE